MGEIFSKIVDNVLKLLGAVVNQFWGSKIKSAQITVRRLSVSKMDEVEEFIELYGRYFPEDGTNYTKAEILDLLEDMKNAKKHVEADNIILTAHYKDGLVGFIICHYYPQKKYGIISYFAKDKAFTDGEKYVGSKLLRRLRKILTSDHTCELIVFELQMNAQDRAKSKLFKLYASSLSLKAMELQFAYDRPKLSLTDQREERLALMIVPIGLAIKDELNKNRVIDILSFIHFYCYGDIYDKKTDEFAIYHGYLKKRMDHYRCALPNKIETC